MPVVVVFVVVFIALFGGLMWVQRGSVRDTGSSTLTRRRVRLVRIVWLGLGVFVLVLWLQQR
jgi:hypothetical protein